MRDLFNTHEVDQDNSLPAVNGSAPVPNRELAGQIREACRAWLVKSPSSDTRSNYHRDVRQFFSHASIPADRPDMITTIRPHQVAAWRDHLAAQGLANSSILRKMTALRSLFTFLQIYGYLGTNPAHSDFVDAPTAPRDGKTVALSAAACRRLLDAPLHEIASELPDGTQRTTVLPDGVRDRALLAVLAYTGCRVGELARLKVSSYKESDVHKILEIHGKGGRDRIVPLHKEAELRLEAWLTVAGLRNEPEMNGPLFRPVATARGHGVSGFAPRPLGRRAIQKLVERYVAKLGLDRNVTVHSLRVTALTTARERGSDIIDLQDFAGHQDPSTTLCYIRNRNRLMKSPAYLLSY